MSLKMSKKDANGVLNTFKSFNEKFKLEKIRNWCLMNVELDHTLKHFKWNGIDTIQYQIIPGDYEHIAKLIPKREYALVIVDIPYGFNF